MPYRSRALLDHGLLQAGESNEWFNYVGHYGLNDNDVPQLFQLASAIAGEPGCPNERDAPIGEPSSHRWVDWRRSDS